MKAKLLERLNAYGLLLLGLYALLYAFVPSFMEQNALVFGLLLLACCNFQLLTTLRKSLIFMDLLFPIAVFMLWVMPAVAYLFPGQEPGMYGLDMYVTPHNYFRICIPGVLAIGLGAYLPVLRTDIEIQESLKKIRIWGNQNQNALVAIILLICSSFLWPYSIPESFQFLNYLISLLLFLPMLYWALSPASWRKYMVLGAIFAFLFLNGVISTMFGDLILWLTIATIYCAHFFEWPSKRMLSLQVLAALSLFWLISFKYQYRKSTAERPSTLEKMRSFSHFASQNPFHAAALKTVVSRLNQGSVMSLAFRHVPEKAPFAQGETLVTALKSAFIPRLLWPDKPKAGGVDNASRFMGLNNLGYSINLGLLGEAYVNFGLGFCFIAFLVSYSWLLRLLESFWRKLSLRFTWLILALPIVFISAISVEIDALMVFNHVIKASFLLGLICTFIYFSKNNTLKNLCLKT